MPCLAPPFWNHVSVLVWPPCRPKALGWGGVDLSLICSPAGALSWEKADNLGWLWLRGSLQDLFDDAS